MRSYGARASCSCVFPFIKDSPNSCKCPPGYFYVPPTGNGHIGQCQVCNSTSILVNTSGYVEHCTQCPSNMLANSNRTDCGCSGSFIKGNNDQCICNRGYFYAPGTGGQPGNCIKCNDTSILMAPGLHTECVKCKANQYSNDERIDCSCAPGFINVEGTCMCPPGYRYAKGKNGAPGQCKVCPLNFYQPEAGLKTECLTCGSEAISNFNHTTCFCKDGSNF